MRQGSLGHHHFLRPTLKTGFSQKLGIHERQGLGPVIELATQTNPSIVSVISSSRSGPGWLILRYSVLRVVDVRQGGIYLFSLSIEVHNLSYRVIKLPPNSRLNSARGSAYETAQILSTRLTITVRLQLPRYTLRARLHARNATDIRVSLFLSCDVGLRSLLGIAQIDLYPR